MNKRKLQPLKEIIRDRCNSLGHDVRVFRRTGIMEWTGTCKKCGGLAIIHATENSHCFLGSIVDSECPFKDDNLGELG